ncbi:MAG: RnfH family protein [Brachymonas sp.]|nr:RnfH family protein [Brachymonas sp.]
MAEASRHAIEVTLVWSPAPRVVHEISLRLSKGAVVREALVIAAQQDARFADARQADSFGIWNRRVTALHVLRDGERLEIYRPLRVDPKVARRERFQKQGAKSAGLFATRRPGAKPGY